MRNFNEIVFLFVFVACERKRKRGEKSSIRGNKIIRNVPLKRSKPNVLRMWSDSNWCQWNPSVYTRIYICVYIYIYTRCPREAYDAGGAESNGEIYVYGWWIYDRCKYGGSPSRAPSSAGSLFAIRRTSLSRQTGLKGFFIARDSTWITLRRCYRPWSSRYIFLGQVIELSRNSRGHDRPPRFVANEKFRREFFFFLRRGKKEKNTRIKL